MKNFLIKKIMVILFCLFSYYSYSVGLTNLFIFDKKIPDTQKSKMLNSYCLYEAMESDDSIKYDECLLKNELKNLEIEFEDNFDNTKNIQQTFTNNGSTYSFSFADKIDSNTYIFEYRFNGGGSGYFSKIVFFSKKNDVLKYLGEITGGDRCNDGHINYLYTENAETFFARSATPFRLLNYKDDTQWREMYLLSKHTADENGNKITYDEFLKKMNIDPLFLGLHPYDDIDNAAASCYGWIVNKNYDGKNTPIAIILNKPLKHYSNESENTDCFDLWFEKIPYQLLKNFRENDDYIFIGIKEWDLLLNTFKTKC